MGDPPMKNPKFQAFLEELNLVLYHCSRESCLRVRADTGNTKCKGRLSTVGLLIKVTCFVTKANNNTS